LAGRGDVAVHADERPAVGIDGDLVKTEPDRREDDPCEPPRRTCEDGLRLDEVGTERILRPVPLQCTERQIRETGRSWNRSSNSEGTGSAQRIFFVDRVPQAPPPTPQA